MRGISRTDKKQSAGHRTNPNRSAGYARNRMKNLINAERIGCSPRDMDLMKKDLIHTLRKYFSVEEDKLHLKISGEPPVFRAEIPISRSRRNKG